MVEETFEPGMTVSLVARRHGVAPNQLFTWRRLVVEGALTAAGSGEQVVPASDYRALQSQVRPAIGNRPAIKMSINNREAKFPEGTGSYPAKVTITRDNLQTFFQ